MKNKVFSLALVAAIVLSGALSVVLPSVASAAGPWFVSPAGLDTNDCLSSGAACLTIQAAITKASSGDTINVAAGTYDAFSVVGKMNLTITGAGVGSTLIHPTTLINTGIGHKYTNPMQVSVFVNNSTGITLQGMDVQDNGSAPGAGGPDALIFWNASTGNLTNMEAAASYTINGDQTGQGIAVDASSGQTANLTVTNTIVSGFQKNGYDIQDGNGVTSGDTGIITVDIEGGSITGAGATTAIAQNGVVSWNRGGGTVNTKVNGTAISNLDYTGVPADTAAGIIAYAGGNVTPVSHVNFSNVQIYIQSMATGAGSTAIDATTGNTFDGVSPATATDAQIAAIENKLSGIMEDATGLPIYILPNTLIVTTASVNRGVQAGIDSSPSAGTVLVTLGTYPVNANIAKALTINGAQAGVAAADTTTGTPRSGSESIVSGMNITASNVTVNGFSFNNSGAQMSVTSPTTLSGVVVKNNIFSGYSSVGFPTSNAGNLAVMGNFFTNPGESTESIQIKANSDAGGCNGTNVSNNVFTAASNNSGADINFSCTDSGSTNVTVSGNRDTGLAGGGPSFTAFSGVTDGIKVTNNTVIGTLTSGSAVFFFGSVSGSALIDSNHITSGGSSAISIHGADSLGTDDTANSGIFTITNNVLSGNVNGISVSTKALTSAAHVNANRNDVSGNSTEGITNGSETIADGTCNWWGDASGPSSVGPGSGSHVTINATYNPWLVSSNLSGACNGGVQTVNVTIDKFIDGKMATAASANSAAFPMVETWTATNFSGTGVAYSLSTTGVNSPNAYEAITAPGFDVGGTYTTNEVTTGPVVGADCSEDPYSLVGYTTGVTFAAAAAATPSLTVPNFADLTSNEFVIVWNKDCLPAPILVSPANNAITTTAGLTSTNWNSVTDAAGGITYIYQSSNSSATNSDGSFVTPAYTSGALSATTIPTPGTPAGVYFWHVKAMDADGNASPWSEMWTFTVSNTGTLVVEKAADGGDGTFTFTSDIPGGSSFSITTANNVGYSQTFMNLTPGAYHVTEVNIPKGWTMTDNECSTVTVTAGGAGTCVITNTNNKLLGEIRGTKYADRDGDGKLSDGDHHRLAGWVIYIDKNNNGILDTGEVSTVTDSHGNYHFSSLPAGTYVIREVGQTGWIQTVPGGAGSYTIVLAAGKISKKNNFGNFKLGTISGMKYNDVNGNGHKNSGDVGLAGWTIKIKGPHGFTDSTVTDANGNYSFTGLLAGTYTLSEVQQAGWHQTDHPGTVKIQSGTNSTNDNFGNTQKTVGNHGDGDNDKDDYSYNWNNGHNGN